MLKYLDPSPTDHILDIGCGDGPLTAQIASLVPSGRVLGLDASTSMVSTAEQQYPETSHPNCSFRVQDCTRLAQDAQSDVVNGTWDKVFSNAALHWIMRNPETRMDVFRDVYAALKPGGAFVFEMGGKGNVAEVHAALLAGLVAHGVPIQEAREASPWFFPSEVWMRRALEESGFVVEICESEYRPTRTTAKDEEGQGGLEGWVKLMGAAFLEKVDESRRQDVVKWVCEVLQDVDTREEDGSTYIGYVRLRAVARKA